MVTHDAGCDVVVAGGGVIGLASAWRIAQTGRAVMLADPALGRGASWAAAGMLAPATEATFGEEALLALNLASARRWEPFATELAEASGVDPGLRRTGAMVVARDADDARVLDQLAGYHARLGLPSRQVGSREARRLEPGLSPRTRGALVCDGDHQVDNRALVEALRAAVENLGVTLARTTVTAVESERGRTTGVRLGSGRRLACDQVVIAAGWRSAEIEGIGMPVPLRPVKGQLLHLRAREAADRDLATRLVRGLTVYVVPRGDGRVVVGATVEERHDQAVTVGGVLQLLRDAWELLPGIAEFEIVETVVGFRPTTPDNGPMIGHADVEGVVMACGHHRHGILLTPVTAEAVAALITGNPPPAEAKPFTPARFATRSTTSR